MYAGKHAEPVRRTGLQGDGADLGEALFSRQLESPEGGLLSTHTYEAMWKLVR
jgi:hypothetical protein